MDHHRFTHRRISPEEIQKQAEQAKSLAVAGLAQSLATGVLDADRHQAAHSALITQAFAELAEALAQPAWRAAIERFGAENPGMLLDKAARVGAPGSILKILGAQKSEPELSRAALWAARMGHAESTIELIALGASFDAKERDARTLLHHCAADVKPGHLALMAFLLAEGASPLEREAQFGATPLMWACYSKNPAAARLLVGSGGLDIFDNRGRTALAYCSVHDGDAECAQILLTRGADLHAKLRQDNPCAFESAILEGSPAALAMAPWADFSKRATDGSTWMEFAVRERGYIPNEARDVLVGALIPADQATNDREILIKLLAESKDATPKVRKPTL